MKTVNYIKNYLSSSENTFHLSVGIFSFLILAFPKLVAIGFIFIGFSVLHCYSQKTIQSKKNWILILFILLYLVYVFGILFSKNYSDGLKYAEYKLSFLIIPILFSFKPAFKINLKPAIIGLILGVLYLGIHGCFSVYQCLSAGGETFVCWTSTRFSEIHHPSYFASFILIAIAGGWHGYFQKWRLFHLSWIIPFTIFGVFNYILCFSIAAFLFLILVMAVLLFYVLYKKLSLTLALIVTSIIIISSIFSANMVPHIHAEVTEMRAASSKYLQNPSQYLSEKSKLPELLGNDVRLIMWTVSTELILEHPFGVGTGNLDFYIEQKLRKHKLDLIVNEHYNPHNQYLQTTLEIGLIGLFLLVALIFLCFSLALRTKSYLFLLIISLLSFNSLFESILQRQSGIVFYTFWICLMTLFLVNNKKKEFEGRAH